MGARPRRLLIPRGCSRPGARTTWTGSPAPLPRHTLGRAGVLWLVSLGQRRATGATMAGRAIGLPLPGRIHEEARVFAKVGISKLTFLARCRKRIRKTYALFVAICSIPR